MIKQFITVVIVVLSLSTAIAQPMDYVSDLATTSAPQNYFYQELPEILPMYDLSQYKVWDVITSRKKIYSDTLWFVSGNCTVYVAHKRPDIFLWKGKNLLNWDAYTRFDQAKRQWLTVGKEPQVWAIAIFRPGRGALSLWHVAIVEYIGDDWLIVISDMNFKQKHVITERIVPSDLAVWYIY